MKLVDILAQELKEWPENCADWIAQDGDGYVFAWSGIPERGKDQWLIGENNELSDWRYGEVELSDDNSTAIVTRAEWQAASNALKTDSPSLHIQQSGRFFRALSSDPADIARAHISNLIYGAMSKLGSAPTVAQVNAAASALTAAGYQQFEIIDEPKS